MSHYSVLRVDFILVIVLLGSWKVRVIASVAVLSVVIVADRVLVR